jgi:septum formation protein
MIYLASQSPRRAELLRQIGVQFEVRAADVDESQRRGEAADAYVCRVAGDKASVVAAQLASEQLASEQLAAVVLAADTTIALAGRIIGKPRDDADCCCILRQLSGREHTVLSAVALVQQGRLDYRLSRNRVWFRKLDDREIESYCASAEPMDKAGAYAIQGKAAVFIERLEGSYSAVMGLPLCETAVLLGNAGIEIF